MTFESTMKRMAPRKIAKDGAICRMGQGPGVKSVTEIGAAFGHPTGGIASF